MTINVPFKVCKKKIVNTCEKCGHKFTLAEEGQKVRIGDYICPTCGTPFKLEVMPDGELGIILTPIDNFSGK